MYEVSPQPAQAPWNSKCGFLKPMAFSRSSKVNFSALYETCSSRKICLTYSVFSTVSRLCMVRVPLAAVGQILAQRPQPVQSYGDGWMANLNLPYLAATTFLESRNWIGELTISSSVARYGLMTACGQATTQFKHWTHAVGSQTGMATAIPRL